MKVPHAFTPRTRPSAQPLAYLNVDYSPDAFGAQLGRSLVNFGDAFQALSQRQQQNSRFDTLNNFSEFETNVRMKMQELKSATPEDASNYFQQAEAIYQNEQSSFLNKVDPSLRKEFEFRANQFKQGVIMDSFKFNFDQQNLFYTNKINERLNKVKVELDQNPAVLEQERSYINDMIDSSGLPEIEKAKQRKLASAALEAITYKSEVRDIAARSLRTPDAGIVAKDLPPQAGGILNAISGPESGHRYNVRYTPDGGVLFNGFSQHPRIPEKTKNGDVSTAAGRYQDTASTWDIISKELGLSDFSPYSQDHGNWYWAQKTYKDKTGEDITSAIQRGDWHSLRTTLATQWEGLKNISDEEFKKLFEAGSGSYQEYAALNNDPSFANLSYEDRLSIRNDAMREAGREYSAQLDNQKAIYETAYNSLLTGINDGNMGQADWNSFRDTHPDMPFSDIIKGQELLNKVDKENKDYRDGLEKLDSGLLWVNGNSEDNKKANALFNKGGGPEAFQNMDGDYISNVVLPRWQKMNMAAPDQLAMMSTMMNTGTPPQAAFAYDLMRRMQVSNPQAFDTTFSPKQKQQLDTYKTLASYYPSTEALIQHLQGRGLDAATRQANEEIRTTARDFATKNLSIDDAMGVFGGYFTFDPSPPIDNAGKVALDHDYKSLFVDAMVATGGNEDKARELADKQIQHIWGVTDIGGQNHVARLSPEKAGYKAYNGNWKWIDQAVYREMPDIKPGQQFQLIADDRTQHEINQFGQERAAGKTDNFTWPTYLVYTMGEDGVQRIMPQRIWFKPDQATLEADANKWQAQHDRQMLGRLSSAPDTPENNAYRNQLKEDQLRRQQSYIKQQFEDQKNTLARIQAGPQWSPGQSQDSPDRNYSRAIPSQEYTGSFTDLRPFKAGEQLNNADGTQSTELTTTQKIESQGTTVWVNIPSLWMSPQGPVQFDPTDDHNIIGLALLYEQRSGKQFTRYATEKQAVAAAKRRSNEGGAASGETR